MHKTFTDGWLAPARASDEAAPDDRAFAETFVSKPGSEREVVEVESHLIEDEEFHARYGRGAYARHLVSDVVDALSLGLVPLYRAMKREWGVDSGLDLYMGIPVRPSPFQRAVRAVKRGVQLVNDYTRADALDAFEASARSDAASLEGIVGSESDYAASYDSVAIGQAYVSETLAGRTLNRSAMRAVEAKRSRLETFANAYAETGSIGEAAVAVGITTERTIDEYVRRTGVSVESADRSKSGAE